MSFRFISPKTFGDSTTLKVVHKQILHYLMLKLSMKSIYKKLKYWILDTSGWICTTLTSWDRLDLQKSSHSFNRSQFGRRVCWSSASNQQFPELFCTEDHPAPADLLHCFRREKGLTFQAARPPQARVGHHLLILLAGLVLAHGLGPADSPGVQPVVRADRDGHEAEGREGANRGQQHLDSAVEQTHVSAFHERGAPFPLNVQEVNIWKFTGPNQTEKTGYTRAEGEGRRRRRMR